MNIAASIVTNQSMDPNELWSEAKQAIITALRSTQPCPKTTKKQHWMSAETFEVIENRRILKSKGLNNPAHQEKYNQLSRIIRAKCRKDKNEYLNKSAIKYIDIP